MTEKSLYQRIGGYDVIASIVDVVFARMRADPRFSRFGQGRGVDSRDRAQQLTVELLCHLAGGPGFYIGRDMKTAHGGLGITETEWDAQMNYVAAVLDEHRIPRQEKEEFLALFSRYKDDIVESAA